MEKIESDDNENLVKMKTERRSKARRTVGKRKISEQRRRKKGGTRGKSGIRTRRRMTEKIKNARKKERK
jgi:hypothetical protein